MNSQKLGRVGIAFVLMAGLLLACQVLIDTKTVNADSTNTTANQNIVVNQVLLGKDSHGIVMVDTESEHIWLYEVNKSAASHNRLKLIAARSYKYDKQLDQYNTGEPTPEQVRKLLEKQEIIKQKEMGNAQ